MLGRQKEEKQKKKQQPLLRNMIIKENAKLNTIIILLNTTTIFLPIIRTGILFSPPRLPTTSIVASFLSTHDYAGLRRKDSAYDLLRR